MGNRHFLYTGFIPEVVRAGMDRIPSRDADPEVVLPSTSELMARRAAEKGDGNLWAREIHYPKQDLFIPADFPSSSHIFTVWAIKNGTHLMAAECGKGYQHWYKVVLLEHGVPVENTIPYDSEREDPCPTVNAYLVPQGLIQDPPASWTDEATICSPYNPHSWEEFEASKAVFASCSTQVQQYLLKQCWRWNSALSVSPEDFDTPESIIETWPGGEHSFSPAMALIFRAHASRWKKYVRLMDGVPTEFQELTLKEDACFGPNPPIPTPLPTLEDLAQGRKPAGAFVLAVDSQGTDPMADFAISVLAVASRDTMSTLYQVSTDWTFDSASLFLPADFHHPKLCITTWEQGKAVRRMEGDHGENASTMSKWVQLKDGIPTEVIGVPAAAPSNPKLDENDEDSGPPDPALRPQYKTPPRPGNQHDLPSSPSDAASSSLTGDPQQGPPPSDGAYFVSPTVKGPNQSPTDDPSPSSATLVGRSGDNPNYKYQAGQDNLLANPGSMAQSVCTPPSPDTAGLWTPAPAKRRRAFTKRPPASPPRDSSQDPKKSKDSAFSSPVDV